MQLMFSKTMEKRWQEWSAPRLAMVGSLDPVYPMWARYSSTLAVIIGCVGVLSVQFLKEWKTFCKRRKFHTNEIRHYSNLPTFTISAVTPCRSAVALLLSQMCTLNHFEREKVGCGPCVCVCVTPSWSLSLLWSEWDASIHCYFQKFLSHTKNIGIIDFRPETVRLVKTRFTEQLAIKISSLILLKKRQGKKLSQSCLNVRWKLS